MILVSIVKAYEGSDEQYQKQVFERVLKLAHLHEVQNCEVDLDYGS